MRFSTGEIGTRAVEVQQPFLPTQPRVAGSVMHSPLVVIYEILVTVPTKSPLHFNLIAKSGQKSSVGS